LEAAIQIRNAGFFSGEQPSAPRHICVVSIVYIVCAPNPGGLRHIDSFFLDRLWRAYLQFDQQQSITNHRDSCTDSKHSRASAGSCSRAVADAEHSAAILSGSAGRDGEGTYLWRRAISRFRAVESEQSGLRTCWICVRQHSGNWRNREFADAFCRARNASERDQVHACVRRRTG
jgi:hypothetical protein